MIHTDADEGPVPVEVLQFEAAKANEADLAAARERAEEARATLQAFKDWVHSYLDAHGVPHHPPGPHGAEGCRIGDRLDWLLAQLDEAREQQMTEGELVARNRERARILRERDAARDRLESAVAALLKYGYHRPSCPAFIDAASNCVCGWQVVRGDTRLAQETAALGVAREEQANG